MLPTIRVAPSSEQLALQAAERFIAAADEAVLMTGRFAVALSGGSTPQQLYQTLARPEFAERVAWEKTHILFSDERCVGPNDPQSNFGMACRTLLDHVGVPYENIHRMQGEIEPEAAALRYQELIERQFAHGLDLVLLGMGVDGHTASLFPDTEALHAEGKTCVANFVPQFQGWRLTLTAGYLNQSHTVLVLVQGREKATRVDEILAGMEGQARYPIQLIQPASGNLVWLLDAEAAGMSDEPDQADGAEG